MPTSTNKTILTSFFISMSILAFAQPNINFDIVNESTSQDICAPVTISINNYSEDLNPSQSLVYKWYENGSMFSSEKNPIRNFLVGGSYELCLEANFQGQTAKAEKCKTFNVYDPPSMTLTQDKTFGCPGLQTTFNIEAERAFNSIFLGFGDGSKVTDSVETKKYTYTHTFNSKGKFDISTFIEDQYGCKVTITKDEVIQIIDASDYRVIANQYSFCSKTADVQFTYGNPFINTVKWHFGDGNTSTTKNPSHTYTSAGKYEPFVVVDQGNCKDTLPLESPIWIGNSFELGYDVVQTVRCNEQNVIYNLPFNANEIKDITWEYGDGSTSNLVEVSHLFESGTYETKVTVELIAGCTLTGSAQLNLIDQSAIDIDFGVNDTVHCDPLHPFEFYIDGPTNLQYNWIMGNGQSQPGAAKLDYVYSQTGEFETQLEVLFPNGCRKKLDGPTITIIPTQPAFSTVINGSCAPVDVALSPKFLDPNLIDSYYWKVGDTKVTDAEPAFTIDTVTKLDVALIVNYRDGCTDSIVKIDQIEVGKEIDPIISWDNSVHCTSDSVAFNVQNYNQDESIIYAWQIGNGAVYQGPKASHTFEIAGDYELTLRATQNKCITFKKLDSIKIQGPTANFLYTVDCDKPGEIILQEDNLNETSYQWIIGDEAPIPNDSLLDRAFTEDSVIIYMQTFDSESGCSHIMGQEVRFPEPLEVELAIEKNGYCLEEDMPLDIALTNTDDYVIDVFADIFVDQQINANGEHVLSFNESGTIDSIVLVAFDDVGCATTYTIDEPVIVSDLKPTFVFDLDYYCDSTILTLKPKQTIPGATNTWFINDEEYSNDDSIRVTYVDSRLTFFTLRQESPNGCSGESKTNYFNYQDKPVVDFDVTQVECNNPTYAFSNQSTSSRPLEYRWFLSTGDTILSEEFQFEFEETGMYQVCLEATNNVGCTVLECDSFLIKTAPIGFIASDTFKSCAATPLVSGFTNLDPSAVESNWVFGDSSATSNLMNPSYTFSRAGVYDIKLISTDALGCKDTTIREDYIRLNGPYALLESDSIGGCSPLQVEFTVTSKNVVKYRWDFGDGSGLIENKSDTLIKKPYVYDTKGTYKPNLILEDQNGCEIKADSDLEILVESKNPNFAVFQPVSKCFGDEPAIFSLVQQDKDGLNASDLTWRSSTVDTIIFSDDLSQVDFLFTKPGVHSVDFEINNTFCISNFELDNNIVVYPEVKPSIAFDESPICGSGIKTFRDITDDNIPGLNQWKINGKVIKGQTNYSHIFKEDQDNTLTFITENIHGCVDSLTKTITVIPQNEIEFDWANPICYGSSIQLNPIFKHEPIAPMYKWIVNSDTVSNDPIFEQVATENLDIKLAVQDSFGCMSYGVQEVEVISDPQNLAIETDSLICLGDAIRASARFDIEDSKLDWYYDDVLICEGCEDALHTPEASGTLTVYSYSPFGCVDSTSTAIEVITIPRSLPEEVTLCSGSPVQFVVHPEVQNVKWSPAVGLDCDTCHTPTLTPYQGLSYTLTGIYKGCQIKETIQVNVISPDETFLPDGYKVCIGEEVKLESPYPATWFVNGVEKAEATIFKWVIDTKETSIQASINLKNCIVSDTIMIETGKELSLAVEEIEGCVGDTLDFSVKTNGIVSFENEGINITSTENLDGEMKEIFLQYVLQEVTSLPIKASLGQCEVTESAIPVKAHAEPKIDLDFNLDYFPAKQKELAIRTGPEVLIKWESAIPMACTDCPDNAFTHPTEDTIDFELNIIDSQGCQLDSTITLVPNLGCKDTKIAAANAFTPNGDGENDEFRIHTDLEIEKLVIFNRWGQLVYEGEANAAWDGTFKGQNAPKGLYTYKLELKCPLNKLPIIKTNELFLIR